MNCAKMGTHRWRVIASSYVIDTHFLRVRKDEIALPNGTIVHDYFVRESRGFVIVFALTVEGDVVLVRQYKHGIGRELLELPAGAIDPGESPQQTAIRELSEETGYTAASWEFVRTFVVDPTSADTVAHLFLARDARLTSQQQLDATENIGVELADFKTLLRLVRDGTIDSVTHAASIYLVLDCFNSQRRDLF